MKEFAFGTPQQFQWLDNLLQDGQCHVFRVALPHSCAPDHARLGFEKSDDCYRIYIDYSITTSDTTNQDFVFLLQHGQASFTSLDTLITFLHSLQPLFDPLPTESVVSSAPPSAQAADDSSDNIVDLPALMAERKLRNRPRMVDPSAISTPLKQKIFGQDAALEALAELVVLNHMRKEKKLLTIMLLGPTATGKSETAKSLAHILSSVYKTPYGFIEIAANEFVSDHSVYRFLGAPPSYIGYGQPTVLDPVRSQPCHVIVINEVEKSHPTLITSLMEAIDTGHLAMSDNSQPIDLTQCILLFTSNLPIDRNKYENASDFQRVELCRDLFTQHCGRPEISGKIGNFIVYQPLNTESTARIIIKFIQNELNDHNINLKSVSRPLMQELLDLETRYGARGIAGSVRDTVGKQLLRQLLHQPPDALAGKQAALSGTIEQIQFEFS